MGNKRKVYSESLKKSVLKRLEQPTNETVATLSKELDIPKTTIYGWKRKNKKSSTTYKSSSKWNSQDKFQVVLETASMTEREKSEYCRKKGIYVKELKRWKKQCEMANKNNNNIDYKKVKKNLSEEKKRRKNLEKDLQTKEKALAETAALLVLRKKANAIWGEPEED